MMVRNKNSSSNVSTNQPIPAVASISRQGFSGSQRPNKSQMGQNLQAMQKTPEKSPVCLTSLRSSPVNNESLILNKQIQGRHSGSTSPSKSKFSNVKDYLTGMNGLSKSLSSAICSNGSISSNSSSNLNGLHYDIKEMHKASYADTLFAEDNRNLKRDKLMHNQEENFGEMKSKSVRENEKHISRMTAQMNVYRKMFGVFKSKEEVLARWSDGLYYLGTICAVDDYKHRCEMKFEDESRFWVRFKDLHRMNSSADLEDSDDETKDTKKDDELDVTCVLCRDGTSDPPNEIVLCDKCGQGYHQICHLPSIDTSVLKDEEVPWQCRNCVFSACVRSGGAISHGLGDIMKQMKGVHPYDMKSLTWNKNHKTNAEEVYCYCGGPGDWYLKMLQCCRCDQWFHEACLQCLESPILYGDRFFLFTCAVCNNGNEYIKRLPIKWVDLVHLVLYNITIAKKVKYYDVDVIISFFNKHMESLRLGELAKEVATRSHLRQKIVDILQSNKTRFQCGSECKKAKVIWGLRNRSPPVPPCISIPPGIEINDESLSSLDLRHGSASLSDSPTPLKKQGPCQSGATISPQTNSQSSGRSPVKDLVKSGLFNLGDASQDNLFDRFRADVFNHQNPLISISDTNMPPPKKRRGRPKKASIDRELISAGLKRTSSSTSLDSSKLSWPGGPSSKKRKRKLSEVSRDSNGSGRTSDAGSAVSRLWGASNSFNDEVSSCSSGSGDKRVGDSDSLRDAITRYFGAEGRVECGERFRVRGKRVVVGGDGAEKYEYLIEWEGYTARELQDMRKA